MSKKKKKKEEEKKSLDKNQLLISSVPHLLAFFFLLFNPAICYSISFANTRARAAVLQFCAALTLTQFLFFLISLYFSKYTCRFFFSFIRFLSH